MISANVGVSRKESDENEMMRFLEGTLKLFKIIVLSRLLPCFGHLIACQRIQGQVTEYLLSETRSLAEFPLNWST